MCSLKKEPGLCEGNLVKMLRDERAFHEVPLCVAMTILQRCSRVGGVSGPLALAGLCCSEVKSSSANTDSSFQISGLFPN